MSRKGENIYKRKDGRWEGRYKKGTAADGRTLYGSCYGKTYREVKEKLEKQKQKLPVIQHEEKTGSKKQFGVYCEEWLLVNQNRVKESTIAKYSVAVHNHIKPFFGKYLPEMITTGMTADFMNRMISEKHLSAKTAKDTAIVLKAILKYIARTEKSVELVEVTMPRYVAKETRVLSLEEQQRFIEYLSTQTDSCKFGILFALMTGLRIGEVCALRIRDVSLADRTVIICERLSVILLNLRHF